MSSILVAEDEPCLSELMQEALEMQGHTVRTFGTADEAWDHARASGEPFDLLITDARMPGEMDGFDLAELVHRRYPDIPIILSSGYCDSARSSSDCFSDLLPKPWSLDNFVATCERSLGSASLQSKMVG